jgi:5-methylcytosine-specific restriction enzyme subunit McrC
VTPILLAEGDVAREFALPDGLAASLEERGIATVSPTRREGWWRVSHIRRVGVLVLEGVEVRIAPKLPVPRLFFLLGYARDPKGWQTSTVGFEADDDLVAAIAQGFVRQAERALQRGVLHGYVERDDALTVLRGRLRTSEQIARRHGLPLPLEVRYDEFVDDIAENRILRTAAQALAGLPRVPDEVAGRLRRLVARLDTARLIRRGESRPTWTPTRLNARYVPALRLAELILDASSIEHRPGDVASSGFLVDTWRAFEDFVGVALREALATYQGSLELQDRGYFLDVAKQVRLRPDMVWRSAGRVAAVLDAKYKIENEKGVPDSDLYQMLAYCTALGIPRGHLLYARGLGPVREHEVRHAGTVLACHAFDLEQDPTGILADIQRFADHLAEGALSARGIS